MPVLPNIGSKPNDLAGTRPERELDAPHHVGLTELVRRNGGCDREHAGAATHPSGAPPFGRVRATVAW